jgi:serine protease AprX
MARSTDGTRGDVRQSALWGSGNRGGEFRTNALWGKGGRGIVTSIVAVAALMVPLAAPAGGGERSKRGGGSGNSDSVNSGSLQASTTYVAPELLMAAEQNPRQKLRVIIRAPQGFGEAENAYKRLRKYLNYREWNDNQLEGKHEMIDAVTLEIRAKNVLWLAKIPGLEITSDSEVTLTNSDSEDPTSKQLWPHASGSSRLWEDDTEDFSSRMPAIAIIDSGIESARSDFDGRVIADVKLSSLPDGPGDTRGHGTFVAGVAAGDARGYAGAAPAAKLVSIDVMDSSGTALTSDVIAACEWILANKDKYNIRVANFSLHSARPSNFTRDPLDRAVEKLWFSGIVVVVAAGNYGLPDAPSGVKYAPGNDPFVITVGAMDLNGTASTLDDDRAPFSAYGYTYDGFMKPELVAAGRYMIGPVPAGSTLAQERKDKMVGTNYVQLSGTSFAAPVIAGTAAQILARKPNWTPDQVKGALIATARRVGKAGQGEVGAGQLTASKAVRLSNPPNPNKALNQFLSSSGSGSERRFDATRWLTAAKGSLAWDAVSWADVSWTDVSWTDVSWSDVSWADVSWADVLTSEADSAHEDAVAGDANEAGYGLTDADLAALLTDPDLGPVEISSPVEVLTEVEAVTSAPTAAVDPTSVVTLEPAATPAPVETLAPVTDAATAPLTAPVSTGP